MLLNRPERVAAPDAATKSRRLHEWLIEPARAAGIASIRLELRADNAAVLSFYRRLGFAETQLVPGYYEGHVAARRMTLLLCADAS